MTQDLLIPEDQIVPVSMELARLFIARRGPVAQQVSDGGYRPLREATFTKALLAAHLKGEATYGYYHIDENDRCKMFCLDMDITKGGYVPTIHLPSDPTQAEYDAWVASFAMTPDLRGIWLSRTKACAPARAYLKRQMKRAAMMLASSISSHLQIRTAATFTGNKGIHVYGFTGDMQAGDCRDAAEIALELAGKFAPTRGTNFYADERATLVRFEKDGKSISEFSQTTWNQLRYEVGFDPNLFHNFTIEIFPKQRSLEGKDLGNLLRLPLGRNLHAPMNEAFFLNLRTSMDDFSKDNPLYALTTPDIWANPGELTAA